MGLQQETIKWVDNSWAVTCVCEGNLLCYLKKKYMQHMSSASTNGCWKVPVPEPETCVPRRLCWQKLPKLLPNFHSHTDQTADSATIQEETVPMVSGEIKAEEHFYGPTKIFAAGWASLFIIVDICQVHNMQFWQWFAEIDLGNSKMFLWKHYAAQSIILWCAYPQLGNCWLITVWYTVEHTFWTYSDTNVKYNAM